MRVRYVGILMPAIVAALAMGGASTASAQAPAEPCTLLTEAQVGAAVGGTFAKGEPIYTTGCQWSGQASGHVMVTLVFYNASMFTTMKAPQTGIPKTPVSGIGDDAVFSTLGDLTSLAVKNGRATFVIRIYGIHEVAKQETIEKALAKEVIAKL